MAARTRTQTQLSLEEWEQIQKLTLMDNDFMNVALEGSIPCVEEMLRVILGRDDLVVRKVQTQRFLKGFARSVYLDVYAEDGEGKLYNIEIQRDDEGADPRRPRFHGAMLDTHALKAGQDFKALPERYVIFITQNDVLELGRTAYVIHKYIEAGNELLPFDDGTHLVYVNGAARDDGTELWKLIHDLKCPNASEMYFPRLAERVKFLKEKEEGGEKMSSYFEEQRRKAVAEAVKEAEAKAERAEAKAEKAEAKAEEAEAKAEEAEAKAEEAEAKVERAEAKAEKAEKRAKESIAQRLLKLGEDTLEKIADCTGLTLRQVQALAKAQKAAAAV